MRDVFLYSRHTLSIHLRIVVLSFTHSSPYRNRNSRNRGHWCKQKNTYTRTQLYLGSNMRTKGTIERYRLACSPVRRPPRNKNHIHTHTNPRAQAATVSMRFHPPLSDCSDTKRPLRTHTHSHTDSDRNGRVIKPETHRKTDVYTLPQNNTLKAHTPHTIAFALNALYDRVPHPLATMMMATNSATKAHGSGSSRRPRFLGRFCTISISCNVAFRYSPPKSAIDAGQCFSTHETETEQKKSRE